MKSIIQIITFTKHLWKWYLFMGIFVISISFMSLAVPLLTKQIVDIIVTQVTGGKVNVSRFLWILTVIVAVDVFVSILTTFSQWIGDLLTVKLQTYLSKKFYQHILTLDIN